VAGPYNLSASTPGQAFVKATSTPASQRAFSSPALTPTARIAGVSAAEPVTSPETSRTASSRIHLIVLSLVERISGYDLFTGKFALLFFPTLVVSAAVAAASYYGMERPIMRLGRRDKSYDVSPVNVDNRASAQPNKIDDWTTPEVTPHPRPAKAEQPPPESQRHHSRDHSGTTRLGRNHEQTAATATAARPIQPDMTVPATAPSASATHGPTLRPSRRRCPNASTDAGRTQPWQPPTAGRAVQPADRPGRCDPA
jgi:hypothetical protein